MLFRNLYSASWCILIDVKAEIVYELDSEKSENLGQGW